MTKKFTELTQDFSPERRQRIEARKAELRQEMDLAELRKALALTQSTLAETLGVGQGEISKIEQRTDVFVSTLRRFVQAMGGELEISAVFPDHRVTISNFSNLVDETEETPSEIPGGEITETPPAN